MLESTFFYQGLSVCVYVFFSLEQGGWMGGWVMLSSWATLLLDGRAALLLLKPSGASQRLVLLPELNSTFKKKRKKERLCLKRAERENPQCDSRRVGLGRAPVENVRAGRHINRRVFCVLCRYLHQQRPTTTVITTFRHGCLSDPSKAICFAEASKQVGDWISRLSSSRAAAEANSAAIDVGTVLHSRWVRDESEGHSDRWGT